MISSVCIASTHIHLHFLANVVQLQQWTHRFQPFVAQTLECIVVCEHFLWHKPARSNGGGTTAARSKIFTCHCEAQQFVYHMIVALPSKHRQPSKGSCAILPRSYRLHVPCHQDYAPQKKAQFFLPSQSQTLALPYSIEALSSCLLRLHRIRVLRRSK